MPAISNLSAGEGFLQGFQTADNYLNNQELLKQRRQAIDLGQQQQIFQNDIATKSNARADQALDLQRDQNEALKSLRDQQEKHLQNADGIAAAKLVIDQQQARTKKIVDDMELSKKNKEALRDEAIQYGAVAMNGGAPFPLDLHEKLIKNGMPMLSPYSLLDPNFVKTQSQLGTIVNAVKSGDLSAVNSPDSIDAINQAYADQIGKGIGEFNEAMGGNVVAKRITQLQAGPRGTVVAHVNVHLDNGKSYDAPITVARSSDPHDPVKLHDTGMMLDDVMGRYQMAQMAQNPQYQQSVRAMYNAAVASSNTAAAPSGYRKLLNGNLEPIPGGPADKKASPNNGKALPVALQKMEDSDISDIQLANSMQADLGAIKTQIDNGSLKLGMVSNLAGSARNYLGVSDENSRNLATFKATLEKMRNDSLRLNKGVQTEGDAQRAWNEVFQNINDASVVSKRLDEIQNINARAAEQRMQRVDLRRNNNGVSKIDNWDQFAAKPIIKEGAGQTANAVPASTPQNAARYSVGQVIEHGGRQYRVTGGDLNNDPDVEIVQ